VRWCLRLTLAQLASARSVHSYALIFKDGKLAKNDPPRNFHRDMPVCHRPVQMHVHSSYIVRSTVEEELSSTAPNCKFLLEIALSVEQQPCGVET
jgi:hypothetical protein